MDNTKKIEVFNPVKEDKDGVMAKRMIWSTAALNAAIKGIEQGKKLIANPFYENKTNLLKGDLVFQRTEEEILEWKKCSKDIIYFANKYCKLMTPEGIKNITLRGYQEEYLKHLSENRLSIVLSARQAGKCNSLIINVLAKIDDDELRFKFNKYLLKENGCYEIPLFEIYNLRDKSFIWKIKYHLYKIIYKLTYGR